MFFSLPSSRSQSNEKMSLDGDKKNNLKKKKEKKLTEALGSFPQKNRDFAENFGEIDP